MPKKSKIKDTKNLKKAMLKMQELLNTREFCKSHEDLLADLSDAMMGAARALFEYETNSEKPKKKVIFIN